MYPEEKKKREDYYWKKYIGKKKTTPQAIKVCGYYGNFTGKPKKFQADNKQRKCSQCKEV